MPREMSRDPPLGNLQGMAWDYEKQRYFPIGATNLTNTSSSKYDGTPGGKPGGRAPKNGERKRGRKEPTLARLWDVNDSPQLARRVRRGLGSRVSGTQSRIQDRLSGSKLHDIMELCECHGEAITSIKSTGTGSICMTTDHGKVICVAGDHEIYIPSICSQQLLGIHCNVMRGTWLSVSNGTEPHIHGWRRDHENTDQAMVELSTFDFPHRDIWAMSSYDDLTSLGSTKSLYIARLAESSVVLTRRKLTSDPLAVHHASRDIVFAGLRSSSVVMEDLRVASRIPNVVASISPGKAVIGVQRLKDSAVPWGMAVSGLDHQLAIFDIRFGRAPVLKLSGHVNVYQTKLGLATSPDDTVIVAGGSDRRLRGWSTVTGEQLRAPPDTPVSAFSMQFRHLVQHVDIADDLTLRLTGGGDVYRFC